MRTRTINQVSEYIVKRMKLLRGTETLTEEFRDCIEHRIAELELLRDLLAKK